MAKCSKMANLQSVGMEDMPDEIVLQIFKHLEFYDNATSAQVCKRWKLLSEDQSLWKKINLDGRIVPAKFIEKALRHGCQYLRLCSLVLLPCQLMKRQLICQKLVRKLLLLVCCFSQ